MQGILQKLPLQKFLVSEKLKNAQVLTADYFANAILINNGGLEFYNNCYALAGTVKLLTAMQ